MTAILMILLVGSLLFELVIIYVIEKDLLSPSFVFCVAFFISSSNLLTNIVSLGYTIHIRTVLVITIGVLIFFIGSILSHGLTGNIKRYKKIFDIQDSIIGSSYCHLIPNKMLISMISFNVFSFVYVVKEVYLITLRFGYNGSILGSLGIYAEISKFQTQYNVEVSTISTLLTAIATAELLLLGYFISNNIVYRNKSKWNMLFLILAFASSLLVTFSQGSRGGIFFVIGSIIVFFVLLRQKKGKLKINKKMIFFGALSIVVILLLFQLSGTLAGKNWDIPFYEYLSVYVGDPILNMDIFLVEKFERTPILGYTSFSPFLKSLYERLQIDWVSYSSPIGKFNYLNGHNLGNVYTIFSNLISDFGYIGAAIMLLLIGFITTCVYSSAINSKSKYQAVKLVIYGYVWSCILFSFFSNKICQNISFFYVYVFIFVFLIYKVLKVKIKITK